MAGVNARIPLEDLKQLSKLAATKGTTVSEEIRQAIRSHHDARLSGIEVEGLTGGVTVTLRYVDGWNEAIAVDVDQAVAIRDQLDAAIARSDQDPS